MKRVIIIGSGGAGKSTLASRLGELLQLEVVHLDTLYWKPGWVKTDGSRWKEVVEALAARDSWIMDGNFGGTLELRLEAADTAIFLDFPRRLCLWRILLRWCRYRGRSRPELPLGCDEGLDWEFVKWVWTFPELERPRILEMLEGSAPKVSLFVLKGPAEVEQFLGGLRDG